MDIHKPKFIRSWGEFAGEVGIIVVGVLIALGAEQAVQRWEWHHKMHAAEESMRLELRDDDGPQAFSRLAMHRCIQNALDGIRNGVEQGAGRAEMLGLIERYKVPFWTWDSLAYGATIASDVPTHLPSDRMASWTSAYATMAALDRANEKEFGDAADLHAISRRGGPLSEAERDRLLRAVENLRRDDLVIFASVTVMLPALYDTGVRLDPAVKRQRTDAIRQVFGDCIEVPPEPGAKRRTA
jgi:hypothetical protein